MSIILHWVVFGKLIFMHTDKQFSGMGNTAPQQAIGGCEDQKKCSTTLLGLSSQLSTRERQELKVTYIMASFIQPFFFLMLWRREREVRQYDQELDDEEGG